MGVHLNIGMPSHFEYDGDISACFKQMTHKQPPQPAKPKQVFVFSTGYAAFHRFSQLH
jgi:hypothetical protein